MENPIPGEILKQFVVQVFSKPTGGKLTWAYMKGGDKPNILIVPFTEKRKLVVLKHFRFASNSVILEFPGGNAQDGKNTEEAAQNELLAETGYRSQSFRQISRKPLYFEPAALSANYVILLAENCIKEKELKLEEEEFITPMEVTPRKWLAWIDEGEVIDDKTIAATHLVFRQLGLISESIG